MSERDIGLKLSMRKLLWFAGYASRLNVVLSTIVTGRRSKTDKPFVEGFTDIDVFGVYLTPEMQLIRSIADCKTTQGRVAERLYWIAGVRDYVSADSAYMVRINAVTRSARQLAGRLDLTILDPEDMAVFQAGVVESHPPLPELDPLFDAETVATAEKLVSSLPNAAEGLKVYRKNLYWMLPSAQNLQQMVAQLGAARQLLDPSQKGWHVLFLDCLWLYSYCLLDICSSVRKQQLSNLPNSLKSEMFGGDIALQQREQVMTLLMDMKMRLEGTKKVKRPEVFELTPDYFPDLVDVIARLVRSPHSAIKMLRQAEYLLYCVLIAGNAPAERSLGEFDPVTAKLLVDVAAFLTKSARLDNGFVSRLQELLAGTTIQKLASAQVQTELPAAI